MAFKKTKKQHINCQKVVPKMPKMVSKLYEMDPRAGRWIWYPKLIRMDKNWGIYFWPLCITSFTNAPLFVLRRIQCIGTELKINWLLFSGKNLVNKKDKFKSKSYLWVFITVVIPLGWRRGAIFLCVLRARRWGIICMTAVQQVEH